ncbi:MAG: hypothetical protein AAFQ81_06150 [Pseudomonadota bacterium]
MVERFLSVPHVSRRRLLPRRNRAPVGPDGLHPNVSALLKMRQKAWRERAEDKSLSPPYLAAVARRMAAERAVERALARGQALTREEIKRATDMRRPRIDHGMIRFPGGRPYWRSLLLPVAVGSLPVFAPFVVFFTLTAFL